MPINTLNYMKFVIILVKIKTSKVFFKARLYFILIYNILDCIFKVILKDIKNCINYLTTNYNL